MATIASVGHPRTACAAISGNITTTIQTASDVTGLALAIGASETWIINVHMKVGTSTNAGTQYAVSFPNGATVTADWLGTSTANNLIIREQTTASTTLSTTSFNTTAALTTQAVGAFVDAVITVINGVTAGTLQVQHAKTTSGTATVYAGATIEGKLVQP